VRCNAGEQGAETRTDSSFPILDPNVAEQLFGESSAGLISAILGRLEDAIETEYGKQVHASGALLNWITGTPQRRQVKGSDVYGLYSVPHVDKVNKASYDVSSLLYLSTQRVDFDGGAFAFNDEEQDLLVEPRQGRMLIFGSGSENVHQVQHVSSGDRFVLSAWFQFTQEHS